MSAPVIGPCRHDWLLVMDGQWKAYWRCQRCGEKARDDRDAPGEGND